MKRTVFFVGISHKLDKDGILLPAFSDITSSGKIVEKIIFMCPSTDFHLINIVDFTPLDEFGKLRYPNELEIQSGLESLFNKILKLQPDIVFMAGNIVSKSITQKLKLNKNIDFLHCFSKINFVSVRHPSYIAVYKNFEVDDYINEIISYLL